MSYEAPEKGKKKIPPEIHFGKPQTCLKDLTVHNNNSDDP